MQLPENLYTAEQSRQLDNLAINQFNLGGGVLMQRAGEMAYTTLRLRWPRAKKILVVCGPGNNGGDGYVVATLARAEGLAVSVWCLGDLTRQSGDALEARKAFEQSGGNIEMFSGSLPSQQDVIVDALLGTGLERAVEGLYAEIINEMNASGTPILALDIASGLNADRGQILGSAVMADATTVFIGLKAGIFTADGPDCCGHIYFDSLDVPAAVFDAVNPFAKRISQGYLQQCLPRRKRNTHKGQSGRVLVIGGSPDMPGAVRLAAEAALYTGAGLVTVVTHPDHARMISAARPELIVHGLSLAAELDRFAKAADVIAIGPGLGQSEWAMSMLSKVLETSGPKVLDADALNLLALDASKSSEWILTPHPGEAATLLGLTPAAIQQDRYSSADEIAQRYGGTCILKGAGTIISGGESRLVFDGGNAALSTAGTGDLLTGAVASFIAQGMTLKDSAATAVWVHGRAAEIVAPRGERGWLASDFLPAMRTVVHSLESQSA